MIQELYAKLNRMAFLAADMFVGRERFATLLLMRLTETVILWLSEDQTFWDDIQEGPRPLGPLGLQQVCNHYFGYASLLFCLNPLVISLFICLQFYLDMKFVMCFASQGRYLSRNLLRVLNEIINKAMIAFSSTGVDPNRYDIADLNFFVHVKCQHNWFLFSFWCIMCGEHILVSENGFKISLGRYRNLVSVTTKKSFKSNNLKVQSTLKYLS